MDYEEPRFDERGLIPAIVQDEDTSQVLTLAYMNRESLDITKREGLTCFYSRSREELWRKGESSGNTQKVVSISVDCDGDALLIKARPSGPACHTGEQSCFHQKIHTTDESAAFSLEALYGLITGRKGEPKEGSYTSYLFEQGEDKILKKVGEESAEVIIAAKNDDNQELSCELADLAYHALVLMAHKGLTLREIRAELSKRHMVDKKSQTGKNGR